MYTSFIIVHLPPPPVVSSHLALDLSRSPQQVAGSRSDTVQMNRQMKQREQNTEPPPASPQVKPFMPCHPVTSAPLFLAKRQGPAGKPSSALRFAWNDVLQSALGGEQLPSNKQLRNHGGNWIVLFQQYFQISNPLICESHHPCQMRVVLIFLGENNVLVAVQILQQPLHIFWISQCVFRSAEQGSGHLKLWGVVEGRFRDTIVLHVALFTIIKTSKVFAINELLIVFKVFHTGSRREMSCQIGDRIWIVHWRSTTNHIHGNFAKDSKCHLAQQIGHSW